jgi:hypothetical protein
MNAQERLEKEIREIGKLTYETPPASAAAAAVKQFPSHLKQLTKT